MIAGRIRVVSRHSVAVLGGEDNALSMVLDELSDELFEGVPSSVQAAGRGTIGLILAGFVAVRLVRAALAFGFLLLLFCFMSQL
jgi:hypothetical protein